MTRSVATAGVLALVLAFSAATVAVAQDGVPAEPVENPNSGEVSDMLVPQASSYDTYVEHIRALNACDWLGLMAQYPDDAEVHLDNGTVMRGRQDIGGMFAGFVLPAEEGGLCGITFTEESRFEVGGTQNVQWVAEADFLAEPYRGSDAYVSDGQFMTAMVSTFRGSDLVMAGVQATDSDDDQGDGTEGAESDAGEPSIEEAVKDEADLSEEEAAALKELEDDA